MKKLFILLFIISVSFLVGNESAFSANEESLEVKSIVLKVKIFDFKNDDKEDTKNIEKEMNAFLSANHKIEQIIQTSAGAGTNGFFHLHTVITIFYYR